MDEQRAEAVGVRGSVVRIAGMERMSGERVNVG